MMTQVFPLYSWKKSKQLAYKEGEERDNIREITFGETDIISLVGLFIPSVYFLGIRNYDAFILSYELIRIGAQWLMRGIIKKNSTLIII